MDCFPYQITFKYVPKRLTVVYLHIWYPSASKRTPTFFAFGNYKEGSLANTKTFPKNMM